MRSLLARCLSSCRCCCGYRRQTAEQRGEGERKHQAEGHAPEGQRVVPATGFGPLRAATLKGLAQTARTDPHTRFGLHLTHHPCKVVKVYDGDSITLAWPREGLFDSRFAYANTRLYGIDTPELRGTTGKQRSNAEACRDALAQLVLGELFVCSTVGPTGLDKYGRPLVVIHTRRGLTSDPVCDEVEPHGSLNDWALKVLPGCVPYFGGTKGAAVAGPAGSAGSDHEPRGGV